MYALRDLASKFLKKVYNFARKILIVFCTIMISGDFPYVYIPFQSEVCFVRTPFKLALLNWMPLDKY